MKHRVKWVGIYTMLLTVSCSHDVTEPVSRLQPDKTVEIADNKAFAKEMFQFAVKKIADGDIRAIILTTDNQRYSLKIQTENETSLLEFCSLNTHCTGGIYASVGKHQDENSDYPSEIFYRVHQGKKLEPACAWIEHYKDGMDMIDQSLHKDITGRMLYWVRACFDNG